MTDGKAFVVLLEKNTPDPPGNKHILILANFNILAAQNQRRLQILIMLKQRLVLP